MNSYKALLVIVSVFCLGTHARAACVDLASHLAMAPKGGDQGGNAGNGMEILFRAKANEILEWVDRTGLKDIDTHGIDKAGLSERLLTQKWRVCMVDEKVYVDGRERTCRNSFDATSPELIECSAEAFAHRETEESRYALVFHELLGVAGVEKNLEGESDDSISRQILKFIGMKMSPYLADEQVQSIHKAVFIKDPIHQETGLPFGLVYFYAEGKWICKYLGYSEYLGGIEAPLAKEWAAHFKDEDFSFEVVWNMRTVRQIVCR